MSATHRASCKACKRHKAEAGPISWQGYCGICGPLIWNANCDQLHARSGRFYEHWMYRSEMAARKRRLAYMEGIA